jgi:hypothetical protein
MTPELGAVELVAVNALQRKSARPTNTGNIVQYTEASRRQDDDRR